MATEAHVMHALFLLPLPKTMNIRMVPEHGSPQKSEDNSSFSNLAENSDWDPWVVKLFILLPLHLYHELGHQSIPIPMRKQHPAQIHNSINITYWHYL